MTDCNLRSGCLPDSRQCRNPLYEVLFVCNVSLGGPASAAVFRGRGSMCRYSFLSVDLTAIWVCECVRVIDALLTCIFGGSGGGGGPVSLKHNSCIRLTLTPPKRIPSLFGGQTHVGIKHHPCLFILNFGFSLHSLLCSSIISLFGGSIFLSHCEKC